MDSIDSKEPINFQILQPVFFSPSLCNRKLGFCMKVAYKYLIISFTSVKKLEGIIAPSKCREIRTSLEGIFFWPEKISSIQI